MNNEQLARYSKNIFLPEIDLDGQEALLSSSVMMIGLGGIGSICAKYLAASGVGTLYLSDHDTVEITNLQRQIAYNQKSIGQKKTDQMKTKIQNLNQDIKLYTLPDYNQNSQTRQYIKKIDLIIDCSDNFKTRFLINQDAYHHQIYHISAAAIGFKAQISSFNHPHSACYNCLYDDSSALENAFDEECSNSGILGPVAGLSGSIAACEAIKMLSGIKTNLTNQLLTIDALNMKIKKRAFEKDSNCPTCKK